MSQVTIIQELQQAASVLERVMASPELLSKVEQAAQMMSASVKQGGKIISCGNGGSHCDAMHFAEELTGKYREPRQAIPAICVSDPSHISCVGNDYGYDHIFSRYLEALGQKGDVLLAITTSGNSANVVKAAETARQRGMKVVALTGNSGGKLAALADVEIRVPHQGFADRIQEIHIKVIHILILLIEKALAA
ncbi:MAG: D-sedoheptulose 7-phosphate isomerase [Cyclobacteriaceae bacterium]|jgi:D-sedoheptulose 7-phosphate isomerase|nr:D-sedoheptulose 7-phosphate isomerase [Flammeovirgaceae bacterium]